MDEGFVNYPTTPLYLVLRSVHFNVLPSDYLPPPSHRLRHGFPQTGRDVGDAGIMQLTPLRLLETLDVFSASITDFGVAHGLAQLPSLTSLEVYLLGQVLL